jgi:hypothetical protein
MVIILLPPIQIIWRSIIESRQILDNILPKYASVNLDRREDEYFTVPII